MWRSHFYSFLLRSRKTATVALKHKKLFRPAWEFLSYSIPLELLGIISDKSGDCLKTPSRKIIVECFSRERNFAVIMRSAFMNVRSKLSQSNALTDAMCACNTCAISTFCLMSLFELGDFKTGNLFL